MNRPALLLVCVTAALCADQALPNPYRTVEGWLHIPPGRPWGQTPGVDIGPDGAIWVLERCGGVTCAGRAESPIFEFDRNGRVRKNFGAGLFVHPHGFFVDREGNVWVTDVDGHRVVKLNAKGEVLLSLGTAGVAGNDATHFNRPSDVAVSATGDIFVADGHGGDSNARIVKFDRHGGFIASWGHKGNGPGEFDSPHSLAFDSRGRLFVADKGNNRIQIFDQSGKFQDQWKQFGRPSGIFIDRRDAIYVTDSSSDSKSNPGVERGIRVGRATDGVVTAFIADLEPDPDHQASSGAECVAADASGNIYGAEDTLRDLKKYVR